MYHFCVKILSRRHNQSVVAAAAYRSGERLYDARRKQICDYSKKRGVVYSEVMLPKNAPEQFRSRELLWNAVEIAEKRADARLAREAEFALPRECTLPEQIALAKTFVLENFVSIGMCADLCIHHRDEKNPHVHVLLTDRPISESGFLDKKDPAWNRRELIFIWRESWAKNLNQEYARKGLEKRVTHESYKTRGITDRKPTRHLGRRVLEYAKHGRVTDRLLEHLALLHSDAERKRIMALLRSGREYRKEKEHTYERTW